jgi:hypothetical protein
LTEVREVKRATAGFIISLIGGIIDALVAILLIGVASFIGGLESYLDVGGIGLGYALATLGVVGLVLAILVIIGSILIYMPGKEVIGGILVLVFSIISLFFTAGGLFIGLILGIIGGALGLAKK